jgi:hypothetical protein
MFLSGPRKKNQPKLPHVRVVEEFVRRYEIPDQLNFRGCQFRTGADEVVHGEGHGEPMSCLESRLVRSWRWAVEQVFQTFRRV